MSELSAERLAWMRHWSQSSEFDRYPWVRELLDHIDALAAELADIRPKYAHLLAEVDAQDQASSWAATGSDRTVTVNERLIQDDQRGMTPDEIERHVDRLIAERDTWERAFGESQQMLTSLTQERDTLLARAAALEEAITEGNYCRLCDGWDMRVTDVIEHKSSCVLAGGRGAGEETIDVE